MSTTCKLLLLALLSTSSICLAEAVTAPVKEIHWAVDFGAVNVGQPKKLTWAMRAKDQELAIKDITVQGPAFTFQTSCVSPLPPKERCVIEITALPPTLGTHAGLLTVDLHGEKFLIQLSTEGI